MAPVTDDELAAITGNGARENKMTKIIASLNKYLIKNNLYIISISDCIFKQGIGNSPDL
ncbi:hypothetical protein CFPU101_31780 [Chroococcus sp. FPU101]|nr:hypothetical protein CFPU101_31780 [Chroococcus sp. FPU101]